MECHIPATILIIDDVLDRLALMSDVLRRANYKVETAIDGPSGLERARQLPPSLVVGDIDSPPLNGIELCRALRADAHLRHLPFLLVSSRRMETASIVEGLQAGADDYLEVLGEPSRLVLKVAQMLERARAAAAWHALSEAKAESEKMRSLGQLAAGVAHNFNNSLAAILGRTQLLLRSATEEQFRRSLRVIETAALDAAEIVRRIQTFSRRPPAETSGRVSLAALAQDAIQLTRTRWENEARAHGLHYDVRFASHVAASEDFIAGTASELREVLVNLILNALDAMPAGGAVEITESYVNGEIVIEVRDEGSGVPPELLDRIFEPFFTTKGSRGSGLGLALSYSIIDRHGGTLSVASRPPRGATFTIRFPLTTHGKQSAKSLIPGAQLPTRRVLVVDDDEEVRRVLVEVLQTLNQDVTGVGSADAALAAFSAARFDVLFTDLSMPHIDGLTLAALIRRTAPHVHIILSTGYGQSLPGNPLGTGLIDHAIEKPFDVSAVKAALQAIGGEQ